MLVIFEAFFCSVMLTFILLISNKYHAAYSHDNDFSQIQKYHTQPTPRIGGVSIFFSFIILILINSYKHTNVSYDVSVLLSVLPVFIIGLIEDITKKTSPILRMIVITISAISSIYVTHAIPSINYADFEYLEKLIILYPVIGFLLSWFCVVGLTNAYNIIDGYNGLASITAIFNLIGLAFIAYCVGDINIFRMSVVLLASIGGFFVFNYPRGKIFLGDCGAYTIGFVVALLSIYLVHAHRGLISPYSVLLMVIYPVTEMGFSMYRRKFIHKTCGMQPDNKHMHQLVYNCCTPSTVKNRNSMVLPCMLFFIIPQVILAMMFYNSTLKCLILIALYLLFYVVSYFRLAKYKPYKFMKIWS